MAHQEHVVDAAAHVVVDGREMAVRDAPSEAELADHRRNSRVVVVLDTREKVVLNLSVAMSVYKSARD